MSWLYLADQNRFYKKMSSDCLTCFAVQASVGFSVRQSMGQILILTWWHEIIVLDLCVKPLGNTRWEIRDHQCHVVTWSAKHEYSVNHIRGQSILQFRILRVDWLSSTDLPLEKWMCLKKGSQGKPEESLDD